MLKVQKATALADCFGHGFLPVALAMTRMGFNAQTSRRIYVLRRSSGFKVQIAI